VFFSIHAQASFSLAKLSNQGDRLLTLSSVIANRALQIKASASNISLFSYEGVQF
jgi:hypothetical protein